MSVNEILLQAKELSLDERKELVNSLIDHIAMEVKKPKRSLFEIRGMGKGIWQGIDAQEYINELRAE